MLCSKAQQYLFFLIETTHVLIFQRVRVILCLSHLLQVQSCLIYLQPLLVSKCAEQLKIIVMFMLLQVYLPLYFKILVREAFYRILPVLLDCCLLAIANLRAVLEAMTRSNPATPHPIASGMMMPGIVVLVSNLNEKVRIYVPIRVLSGDILLREHHNAKA